jgi:hypothetical protein
MRPNERGRYPIATFGVELGTHRERLDGFLLDWLRWFDKDGTMLPSDEERAEQAEERRREAEFQTEERIRQVEERIRIVEEVANQAGGRIKDAEDRAARLAAKLRELGVDPNQL